MLASVPKAAPVAPFPALLRRSKFASHDPHIAQVYATSGGDAHRGNYGFKRPINFRKRRAHITVSQVDSRESQTVWNNAEQPSRWIRMWDEVAVTPTVPPEHPWSRNLGHRGETSWIVDSDFARGKGEQKTFDWGESMKTARMGKMLDSSRFANADAAAEPVVNAAAEQGLFAEYTDADNIHAMDDEKFHRHLEKVREMRPQFKQFIEAGEALYNPTRGRGIYDFAQNPYDNHKQFLSARMRQKYDDIKSRDIQQQPHLSGGLTYAFTPKLQQIHTRKPQPGRFLRTPPQRVLDTSSLASFAGMSVEVHRGHQKKEIDWKQLASTGERDSTQFSSSFVVDTAQIINPPYVTGPRPPTMQDVRVAAKVKDMDAHDFSIANPHRPGSIAYVVHQEGAQGSSSTMIRRSAPTYATKPTSFATVGEQKSFHGDVMKTLTDLAGSVKPS